MRNSATNCLSNQSQCHQKAGFNGWNTSDKVLFWSLLSFSTQSFINFIFASAPSGKLILAASISWWLGQRMPDEEKFGKGAINEGHDHDEN